MWTNKEIADTALAQAKKIKAQKKQTARRVTAAFSFATCFCLVIGLCFAMPGILASAQPEYTAPLAVATLFAGGTVGSYLVVGLVAFLLGVVVTILCRTLLKNKEDDHGKLD